jgi:hypothetical protein
MDFEVSYDYRWPHVHQAAVLQRWVRDSGARDLEVIAAEEPYFLELKRFRPSPQAPGGVSRPGAAAEVARTSGPPRSPG